MGGLTLRETSWSTVMRAPLTSRRGSAPRIANAHPPAVGGTGVKRTERESQR